MTDQKEKRRKKKEKTEELKTKIDINMGNMYNFNISYQP